MTLGHKLSGRFLEDVAQIGSSETMTVVSPRTVTPVHCARTFEQHFLESLPKWKLGDSPTQLVVPSESLRWHWVDALARSKRALLGVEVLTHPQWIRGVLGEAKLACELRPAWVEHRAGLGRQRAGPDARTRALR